MARRPVYKETPPRQALLKALKQPYFDTEVTTNAAPSVRLNYFTRPIGQADNAGVVKTRFETNLGVAGQLPKPRAFNLFGFRIRVLNANAGTGPVAPLAIADQYAVMFRSRFEFKVGDSVVLEIPLDEIPQGVGWSGLSPLDAAAAPIDRPMVTRGIGSAYEVYDISVGQDPVRIDHGEQIAGVIEWHAGAPAAIAQNTAIRVSLIGISYIGIA